MEYEFKHYLHCTKLHLVLKPENFPPTFSLIKESVTKADRSGSSLYTPDTGIYRKYGSGDSGLQLQRSGTDVVRVGRPSQDFRVLRYFSYQHVNIFQTQLSVSRL